MDMAIGCCQLTSYATSKTFPIVFNDHSHLLLKFMLYGIQLFILHWRMRPLAIDDSIATLPRILNEFFYVAIES